MNDAIGYTKSRKLWNAFITPVIVFGLIMVATTFLGDGLVLKSTGILADAVTRIGVLGAITIPLERSTQVFLQVFNLNGMERAELLRTGEKKQNSATIPAHAFSYLVGVAIALSGIGFLDALIDKDSLQDLLACTLASSCTVQQHLFVASDVLITAGILAGGASGLHKIIEELKLLASGQRRALRQVTSSIETDSRMSFVLRRTVASDGTLTGDLAAGSMNVTVTPPVSEVLLEGRYDRCIVQYTQVEKGGLVQSFWTLRLPASFGNRAPVEMRTAQNEEDTANLILISSDDFNTIVKNNDLRTNDLVQLLVVD